MASEEGRRIAEAMGPTNNACILTNHGLLTCLYFALPYKPYLILMAVGQTIDEAIHYFCVLEKQCHAQLLLDAADPTGKKRKFVDPESAQCTKDVLTDPDVAYMK